MLTASMEMEDAAMEPGQRRGPETPQGVALTGRVPPVHPPESPPHRVRVQGHVLLPVTTSCLEKLNEVPAAAAEDPPVVPDAEDPPCAAPVAVTEAPPAVPAERPGCAMPRGSCLIGNWQEERATNHLDSVEPLELGSEGFAHRHGHPALLAPQPPPPLPRSTMQDAFRPPHRVPLPAQGLREAALEVMLYQQFRQELLEEAHPRRSPMESLSTTHRDFGAGGFQPTLPLLTQPHNYHTEQPRSFWLERACSVPGITGDSPFRRNATFSTPIAEHLEQPLPCGAESCRLQPT